jgi:hypothetical protein
LATKHVATAAAAVADAASHIPFKLVARAFSLLYIVSFISGSQQLSGVRLFGL